MDLETFIKSIVLKERLIAVSYTYSSRSSRESQILKIKEIERCFLEKLKEVSNVNANKFDSLIGNSNLFVGKFYKKKTYLIR